VDLYVFVLLYINFPNLKFQIILPKVLRNLTPTDFNIKISHQGMGSMGGVGYSLNNTSLALALAFDHNINMGEGARTQSRAGVPFLIVE
jgi:hypothetical protein